MNRIFHRIPAFAPDYSGAASVFHDMGGMVVFCCAGGCSGNYGAFDEPRLGLSKRLFSISFREAHLVMGIDKVAKEKITESYRKVGGKFVALIGTPAATIIGTDFQGLCCEIEAEIGVPVLYVETSGLYSYEDGQNKAYQMLSDFGSYSEACAEGERAEEGRDEGREEAREEEREEGECAEKGRDEGRIDVHIIGATPLDAWDYGQMDAFKGLLKACGAENVYYWGDADTLSAISSISHSRLNIAVSVSALDTVRRLRDLYHTPYVEGFPVGRAALEEWKKKLTGILHRDETEDGQAQKQVKEQVEKQAEEHTDHAEGRGYGERVLIVGEQIASNMLREMLQREFGYSHVDVASFFTMDQAYMETGDFYTPLEDAYKRILTGRQPYDLVIGDDFLTRAIPYEIKKLRIPSIAISGLVFMRQSPVLYGERGTLYFEKLLGEMKGQGLCGHGTDDRKEEVCV